MRPPWSSATLGTSRFGGGGGWVPAFTMRAVARMSRARWFIFLRRVYQYQNGPRSDLGSNPFNSPGWLALELGMIVAQMVVTTAVVATSPKERPAWPLRLWVAAYNVGNVLSLPLLYWRHRHSSAAGRGDSVSDDPEMHDTNDALRNSSYLMNKARAFLELFFAMWFVMGNVWVFDARLGSFHRAPRLYALCIGLLAWNAVVYSLPFLLFLLLCCFVPVVGYALGYNMNSASVGRGASDEQLGALPRWRFKEPDVPRDRENDDQMLDYNVLGGKCNRGLSVVDSYKILKGVDVLSKEEIFLACTLGWCIEWLQAYFLVLDDIMDNSQTRRGQPCWFRVPQVGLIAVNDGIILRNHISRILQRHFKGKPYYVDLVDLFNEVEFKTASGQLLDLITTHEGEKDLTKYNLTVHRRIVQYKTAYYSFYLPVACALLLSGENLDNFGDVKNILVEMGTYFQVQDDYLDCFGDPEFIGKIGTDIEDYKCSWLVVQALEHADESQKRILFENYGKSNPESVAKVKDLYKELNLEAVFHEYERESYNKLIADIEAQPSKAVQNVLKSFLHKIYKRQK